MEFFKLSCFVIFGVLMVGCGGGAGGGPAPNSFATTNFALSDNGALASSEYDSENAYQVNDGAREQGGFWSGNVEGDEVVVTLPDSPLITKLRIFTNHDILLDKELGHYDADKPFAVFLAEPEQEPYQLFLPGQGLIRGCLVNESGTVAYSPYGSAVICTLLEPVELHRIIVRPLDIRNDYPIPSIRVFEIEAY